MDPSRSALKAVSFVVLLAAYMSLGDPSRVEAQTNPLGSAQATADVDTIRTNKYLAKVERLAEAHKYDSSNFYLKKPLSYMRNQLAIWQC